MHPLRQLPSVNQVLESPFIKEAPPGHEHARIVAAIRTELEEVRAMILNGTSANGPPDRDFIAQRALARLTRQTRPKLRPVINATGIVLHTNLGRAPMAEEAAHAAFLAAGGYLNLEMDLESGKRSSRQNAIRDWVCQLTGAESATAVNNNAAATVIALRALCQGKEVILSRGQLIEIGGSFRIPEIMAVSGAILREVGTTNITRIADYERAIGPNTAALMQIHTSNYRIGGFTKAASLEELIALGRKHNLKVIDDIGSGAMVDFARFGFAGEPIARDSIRAGADLVLFSGDKLLGGPQAGILAGKKEWIHKVEKDPLMRAFRLDKMTLAALEATLRFYLNEEQALQAIPGLAMLGLSQDELQNRAETLAQGLRAMEGIAEAAVRRDYAFVGGGSLPDQKLPTWVVEVRSEGMDEEHLAQRLRTGDPAVVGRLREGRMVLDARTVFPQQIPDLIAAMRQAVSGPASPG